MGTNNLETVAGGSIAIDHPNQYKSALINDLVPRNSSGVPADIEGSLGSSTYGWLKAYIESGYWSIGDIKPHHSYNGAAPIGQGWFPCLGGIINEANYNTVHGAGSWDTYVVTSALDGKYAPDLNGSYLVGSATTTQSGSSAITVVGNSSNQIDIQHTHTQGTHNHRWYAYAAGVVSNTYDASGNTQGINQGSNSELLISTSTTNGLTQSSFTNNGGDTTTDTSGSTTQSIQPESIEVVYYIRII